MPETDLGIGRWCRARVPERLWAQLRVKCDIANRHVTIVETRPPWDGRGDWTRFPIARLRYTAGTGMWMLYWRDRNLRFHKYRDTEPTPRVQELFDYVAASGDPIFFG